MSESNTDMISKIKNLEKEYDTLRATFARSFVIRTEIGLILLQNLHSPTISLQTTVLP